MYKKILVGIDGSELAARGLEHAIRLAKALGATVTAVTVVQPYEAVAFTGDHPIESREAYEEKSKAEAENIFASALDASRAAGVQIETLRVANRWPHAGIVAAVGEIGADLIVVGSHGRRGLEELFLGSQTRELLTATMTPVLVIR